MVSTCLLYAGGVVGHEVISEIVSNDGRDPTNESNEVTGAADLRNISS
jgi:hypothetical protein